MDTEHLCLFPIAEMGSQPRSSEATVPSCSRACNISAPFPPCIQAQAQTCCRESPKKNPPCV